MNLEFINTILGIIASISSIYAATTCFNLKKTINKNYSNSGNKTSQNAKTKSGNIQQNHYWGGHLIWIYQIKQLKQNLEIFNKQQFLMWMILHCQKR